MDPHSSALWWPAERPPLGAHPDEDGAGLWGSTWAGPLRGDSAHPPLCQPGALTDFSKENRPEQSNDYFTGAELGGEALFKKKGDLGPGGEATCV